MTAGEDPRNGRHRSIYRYIQVYFWCQMTRVLPGHFVQELLAQKERVLAAVVVMMSERMLAAV